jgi:hypothetical protein
MSDPVSIAQVGKSGQRLKSHVRMPFCHFQMLTLAQFQNLALNYGFFNFKKFYRYLSLHFTPNTKREQFQPSRDSTIVTTRYQMGLNLNVC